MSHTTTQTLCKYLQPSESVDEYIVTSGVEMAVPSPYMQTAYDCTHTHIHTHTHTHTHMLTQSSVVYLHFRTHTLTQSSSEALWSTQTNTHTYTCYRNNN